MLGDKLNGKMYALELKSTFSSLRMNITNLEHVGFIKNKAYFKI